MRTIKIIIPYTHFLEHAFIIYSHCVAYVMIKKTKSCDFGLYVNSEEHKDLSPFRFVPKIESLDGPYPICEEILLRGKGANVVKESKAHEEMFHINNLYAGSLVSR